MFSITQINYIIIFMPHTVTKHSCLLFYSFIKKLVANDSKPSPKQLSQIKESLSSCNTLNELKTLISDKITNANKSKKYLDLIDAFASYHFVVEVFKHAVSFMAYKNHILNKVKEENLILNEVMTNQMDEAENNPVFKLTCAYDTLSALTPYKNRIYSIWVLNEDFTSFFQEQNIPEVYKNYFQIQLDESIKQSGVSNSGTDYEDRIADLFSHHNLDFSRHHHEEDDQSQEHDLIINYEGHTIGVGAKRTLRERYKQYNPNEVDFSLVFTIGEDLNRTKADTITNTYHSTIFVADEIYEANQYLQNNVKIYKVSNFSINVLNEILQRGANNVQ